MARATTPDRAEEGATTRTSLRELFDAHIRFVWRTARRLGVRDADLPDVCQEVFVIVNRKLPELDLSTSPRAWLFAVCSRVSADYRRRAYIRNEEPSEHVAEAGGPAPQLSTLLRHEARAELNRILDTLDDDKRAVFVLYELEQMPMADVAEALQCPLQTAYSRLHEARRRVQAAVVRAQRRGTP
jgi:RNA polymerase sigma-70 factor (ECF subfamily)